MRPTPYTMFSAGDEGHVMCGVVLITRLFVVDTRYTTRNETKRSGFVLRVDGSFDISYEYDGL